MSAASLPAPNFKLQTDRLLLREMCEGDRDAMLPVLGDPIAMRYYPHAFSNEEVLAFIQKQRSRYANDGFGLWAMLLKSSGEIIGDCGLVRQQMEGKHYIEVGYHLRRDRWHCGYATEAARACMDYAFTRLGASQVISMIRPENQPSRAVAERNGMKIVRQVFWQGYDHLIYSREDRGKGI